MSGSVFLNQHLGAVKGAAADFENPFSAHFAVGFQQAGKTLAGKDVTPFGSAGRRGDEMIFIPGITIDHSCDDLLISHADQPVCADFKAKRNYLDPRRFLGTEPDRNAPNSEFFHE